MPEEQCLYFPDIKSQRIHRLSHRTREHRIFELDVAVTALLRRGDDAWITATTTGLHAWDWEFTRREFLLDPCRAIDGVRLNDAVVDRRGRIWTGSLNQNDLAAPDGALYRVDPDLSHHQLDYGFSVANGITFSPAGDRLLLSNMLKGEVLVYELDERGNVGPRRLFTRIAEELGFPDGLTVDSLGFVWVCHFKSHFVTRHDPLTGEEVLRCSLPVSNVARACFGGPDLNELFVTTAWHGKEQELPERPLSGDVFRIRTPFPGLAEEKFRG